MAGGERQSSFNGKKYKVIGIKDLPVAERPRERLLLVGAASLSLSELLSVILGQGVPQSPVTDISKKILSTFGGLNNIGRVTVDDLLKIDGIGLAKATRLYACFELARRLSGGNVVKSRIYNSPESVYRLLKPYLLHKDKEHFLVVSLDARNKLIAVDIISIGSINESIVHPREVFRTSISRGASSIVIAHNHPSGDCEPSNDDILATKRLVKVSYAVGIPIVDHIIVSDSDYFSMKKSGLLSQIV